MSTHRCLSPHPRAGAVLLAVLVCLGIASAITGLAVHRSLSVRRQLNHDWQLEQTRMLLDAGIRRTHRNLSQNPNYVGESWILDRALESYATARVEIANVDDEAGGVMPKTENRDERELMPNRFKVTATIRNRDVNPFLTKRSRVIAVRTTRDAAVAEPADDNAGD